MPAYLSLNEGQWIIALLGAFIIGMGKAGLKGLDMLSVTLMAMVLAARVQLVWYYPFYVWQILPLLFTISAMLNGNIFFD